MGASNFGTPPVARSREESVDNFPLRFEVGVGNGSLGAHAPTCPAGELARRLRRTVLRRHVGGAGSGAAEGAGDLVVPLAGLPPTVATNEWPPFVVGRADQVVEAEQPFPTSG
jgi:hypothetical protein